MRKEAVNIKNIGVILLNLGGPDSLEAVRPFLYNLFSDRKIIKLGPSFLQKPFAWMISGLRSRKTEQMYRLIGGKSPLLDITLAQAAALKNSLNAPPGAHRPGPLFNVYVGMTYWHPFIEDTVREMYGDDVETALAVSLYPQYSIATSGSALSKFTEAIRQYPIESSIISQWFDHPLYIEALVDVIKKGLESFHRDDAAVLFSAHSLPVSFIESGDPYAEHIRTTIEGVATRIDIPWHLSYQSKTGPVKWLGPTTEEKILELSLRGIKNLLVVPISFVSDHIETLYEIDILYKRRARELGMRLERAESLNTHPLLIAALKDMILKSLNGLLPHEREA
ncbi:MAG: ferrochelatase [Thermodesulfovibrionales bacterium]